eukprot:XP_001693691.1 predicted protein [Chlamydomonas reinhardtii]
MPAGSKPAMAWVFVCWCLCLPARSTATRADQLWRPLGEPTQFWAGVFHFCTRRVLARRGEGYTRKLKRGVKSDTSLAPPLPQPVEPSGNHAELVGGGGDGSPSSKPQLAAFGCRRPAA